MTTANATELVERQVQGLNDGNLDEVMSIYADDARLILVSPHTLPGSELDLSGKEAITKHMGRVIKGGVAGVTLNWVLDGGSELAWRDTGSFGAGTAFSEAHTATLGDDGLVHEHWIHSVYSRG